MGRCGKLLVILIAVGASGLPLASLAAPPFNCSKATEQAEIAVCDSADLALIDREMNRLYFTRRDALKASGKQDELDALRSEQRAFLKSRNDCGYDTACLTALYKKRLDVLNQLPPKQ